MRHAIVVAVLLLMVACAKPATTLSSGTRSGTTGNVVGAGSSRAAVESFMSAVKAADLQAMSTIWGNEKGPGRNQFKRDELEKRLIVMQCLLQHDRWSFLDNTPQLQTGGRQLWPVTLTRKRATAKTTLTTVRGPAGRWFLVDADLTPLRDFCA